MASVSGATSSLGNTSLRGYGGFASGIDRDSIIEQMTAGTQSKITSQQNKMTKMSWKQESYQSVSSKILELQDNYMSYASGANLKDPMFFAKNQITALGHEDVTKFVSATGTSNMLDYLSILGVQQMASSATLVSSSKGTSSIQTKITEASMKDPVFKSSLLQDRQLVFGTYDTVEKKFNASGIFKFPTSYTDVDENDKDITVDIDYTVELTDANGNDIIVDAATGKTAGQELAEHLNKALSKSGIKSGDDNISDVMEFVYADGKMQLKEKAGKSTNLVIHSASSALKALGYNSEEADGTAKNASDGISLEELGKNQNKFTDTYVSRSNMVQYLAGKKLSISFGGQTKQIELVKAGETFANDLDADGNEIAGSGFKKLKDTIQQRLDREFGADNIEVKVGADGGLEFGVHPNASANQSLVINSDYAEVRNVLGIKKGASNKLNMSGSIADNVEKLITKLDGETDEDLADRRAKFIANLDKEGDGGGLVINGIKIAGVNSNTSLNDMMEKINNNKDVGVKASYLSGTNQFVLVASETGSGRQIDLENASAAIFGAIKDTAGNYTNGNFIKGENAKILVNYGNGVKTMVESSSNTFDLEGLRVTVSGVFGDVKDVNGTWESDTSRAVTFNAKADVDGVTENVKKFVEAYNEMIKEVNSQVTTRPNKSYGPLTEAQKEEMSEKSIENWEKKAKEGLLYNDSTMRSLSMDLQNLLTQMLASGVTKEDMDKIGLSISEDYLDGGTIVFDEAKFKSAMTSEPEKVSNFFTGGGSVSKGFSKIAEETMSVYATRFASKNGNSYGRLIEEAGSEKIPSSISNNQIARQLKEMQEVLETLRTRLQKEQDRYISQFTTMETMINQMNGQASYLAQFQV